MTGRVMENNSPEFTLPFLLFAAFCLEAAVIDINYKYSSQTMNWTNARNFCQKYCIDLLTWNTVDKDYLATMLVNIDVSIAWIGLKRDPTNDSVWKWINVETGSGITGDDLSVSSNWASGQQSSLCAFVSKDLLWYSDYCSSSHSVYCSHDNNIQHYNGNFTWNQASQYCKNTNSYLATINYTNTNDLFTEGWIGLYRVAGKNWSWIGAQSITYTNWAKGEPSTPDCGYFNAVTELWYSNLCSLKLFVFCYVDNLVLVNENKTWEEALSYCNSMEAPCDDSPGTCIYQNELISLQSSFDYTYVRERMYTATTDEIWIGLRFLGGQWWWINGQVQNNPQECPSLQNNCGALSKNGTGNWIARDCSERRNFICLK